MPSSLHVAAQSLADAAHSTSLPVVPAARAASCMILIRTR
jgi:hypothetical protein